MNLLLVIRLMLCGSLLCYFRFVCCVSIVVCVCGLLIVRLSSSVLSISRVFCLKSVSVNWKVLVVCILIRLSVRFVSVLLVCVVIVSMSALKQRASWVMWSVIGVLFELEMIRSWLLWLIVGVVGLLMMCVLKLRCMRCIVVICVIRLEWFCLVLN